MLPVTLWRENSYHYILLNRRIYRQPYSTHI